MRTQPSDLKRRIREKIRKDKGQIAKLCSDLVKIPSENPPGDTTILAGYLKDKLTDLGLEVRTYEPMKRLPNLVASYGRDKTRELVLCAHMDVFPAGRGWSFPPFSGKIVNGRILGRGAVDMKAGLTASVRALEELVELEHDLHGRITIMLVSDEETMGRWGAKWLLDHVEDVRGHACLIGEPGGTDVLTIGEKGIWWFQLTAKGQTAHAAYGSGENSITKLCHAVSTVEELTRQRGRVPSELAQIITEEKKIIEAKYWKGTARALNHLTVNVGVIEGGLKINLVPPNSEAGFDARLPLGLTVNHLENALKTKLWKSSLKGIKINTVFAINPAYTKPKHAFVELARRNVALVTGKNPHLFFRLGSTDGKFFRRAGIPAVTYGPSPRGMGEIDEYVKIDELITTTTVHAYIALDYLNGDSSDQRER